MRIQYAPLLYGRTFHVDFSSEFLAQPDFFTEADASYAFSIVRNSMDHSDFIGDHGRLVVFGNGNYAVTGLVITFAELFKKTRRTPMYDRLDHEAGRQAYGFIGMVVPVMGVRKPFDVPPEVYADMYCEMISPRWNEKYRQSVTKVRLREIDVPEAEQVHDANMAKSVPTGYGQPKTVAFGNQKGEREKLKNYVLGQALKGISISFCSDADEIRPEYRKVFNVLTCENPSAATVISEDFPQAQAYPEGKKSDRGNSDEIRNSDETCISGKNRNSTKVPSYDDILEGRYHAERKNNSEIGNKKGILQPIVQLFNDLFGKK